MKLAPSHYGRFPIAEGFERQRSERIARQHMADRIGWFSYSEWGVEKLTEAELVSLGIESVDRAAQEDA
jgi:hypothetical protein